MDNQVHPITPSEEMTISRRDLTLLAGSLAIVLLFYFLFLDPVAGLFVDDAWYALLGKSLATGQGYQLINSPTKGIFPFYPPFYPLLLSFVFRIFPDFPANVGFLKSVSILSMMILGIVGFFYFRRYRRTSTPVALLIVLLTLLSQQLMFLVTSSLMSECVFAVLLMASLMVTERLVGQVQLGSGSTSGILRTVVLAAASCSALFLTRSIAIAVVIGILLYLFKARLFREALILSLLFGLVAGSWTLYARSNSPTAEQRLEQGAIVIPYSEHFWQRTAGVNDGAVVTWRDLPQRAYENTRLIFGPNVLQIVAGPLFWVLEQFRRDYPQAINAIQLIGALLISLLIVLGYVFSIRFKLTSAEISIPLILGLIILWPFNPIRLLAPLIPFIFYYLICGLGVAFQRLRPELDSLTAGSRVTIVASVLLLLIVIGHGQTLLTRNESTLSSYSWGAEFGDNKKLMDWISRSIPQSEVLISNNPALLTLFTGHKTVGFDVSPERWEMFRRMNLRYLVLHYYGGNEIPGLRNYPVLYRLRNTSDYRVLDLGPPESRPPLSR